MVLQIVELEWSKWDRLVNQPRHEQNLAFMHQIIGGQKTLKFIGGMLTAICAVIAIVITTKH